MSASDNAADPGPEREEKQPSPPPAESPIADVNELLGQFEDALQVRTLYEVPVRRDEDGR